MLKGEIKLKFFKVSYFEATNWGFEPIETKYFVAKKDARRYALKLIKHLNESTKYSDDYEFVQIETERDEIVEAWRAEERKVVHYTDGW